MDKIDLIETITGLRERQLICSIGQWEDFLKSHIWLDLKLELQAQMTELWANLEVERDPTIAAELRGALKAIRIMLMMPGNNIANLGGEDDGS